MTPHLRRLPRVGPRARQVGAGRPEGWKPSSADSPLTMCRAEVGCGCWAPGVHNPRCVEGVSGRPTAESLALSSG